MNLLRYLNVLNFFLILWIFKKKYYSCKLNNDVKGTHDHSEYILNLEKYLTFY